MLCVRGAFAGYSPDLYSLRARRFWSAGRPQGTHPHPSGSDRILLPFRFVSFRFVLFPVTTASPYQDAQSVPRILRRRASPEALRVSDSSPSPVPSGGDPDRRLPGASPSPRRAVRPGPLRVHRARDSCAPRSRRVFGSHARGDGALARRNRFAVSWFASRPHGSAPGAWARRGFPRFARASRFPVFFP